jgi:hypothetical protein
MIDVLAEFKRQDKTVIFSHAHRVELPSGCAAIY